MKTPVLPLIVTLFALPLAACSGVTPEAKYPTGLDRAQTGGDNIYGKPKTIWGEDGGIDILGRDNKDKDNGGAGVAVNSYLWRAALDTISFMPLASADPFGGTIITDWYADPASKNERTKLNVFILGRELKTANLRVKAFRQVASNGTWKDAPVNPATERALEDAILTKARQIRTAQDDRLF